MVVLEELSREEFEKEKEEKTKKIEEKLMYYLPKRVSKDTSGTPQYTVVDAMEYSLMGGGKRLRPMLMREAYALFSKEEEETLFYFMAAMEMIHTYSLVHDDLPAMDDDELRRGRKTTHTVYGEAMGILCGDALLNFAYETALKGARFCKDPQAFLSALSILAEKAGIYGMVGGQVVDVEMTGKPLSKEQLLFIYQLKTGALLEASLMIGGVLSGASAADVGRLERIGESLGMAFQIQDDILDRTSTTEELGKPVHSDEKNEKTTYVTLYGLDGARQAVSDYSLQALGLLKELSDISGVQNIYLNTLIHALIDRKK